MRPLSAALCAALWALASASGCTGRNPLFQLGTPSDAGDGTVGGQDDDDAGQGGGGTGGGPFGETDAASMGRLDGPLDRGKLDLAAGGTASAVVPDVASGSGCLASNPHNCGASGGTNSISFNYTVSGGSNNFIVVGVAATTSIDAASVMYRGATLPALTSVAASAGCRTQLFGGVPVAPGPPDIASATGSGDMSIQVFSFVNVDGSSLGNAGISQSSPVAVPGSPMAVSVTTAQGQVVVDYGCILASGPAIMAPGITVTNNSTIVNISRHAPSPAAVAAGSWRSASASPSTTTTASYAVSPLTPTTWKIVAIALKPMY